MATLIDRVVPTLLDRLVLLAPAHARGLGTFAGIEWHRGAFDERLEAVQRLRGGVYVADGALEPDQVCADGLHRTPEDDDSWHVLVSDGAGGVQGCLWYREYASPTGATDLRLKHSPPFNCPALRPLVTAAVDREIAEAAGTGVPFSEVGGWAVRPDRRCTPEALLLILATFALSRQIGGAIGLATATRRHGSAAMLRRLGLAALPVKGCPFPPYYDPRYRCEMELLRFDTRRAATAYEPVIEAIRSQLPWATVIGRAGASPSFCLDGPVPVLSADRPIGVLQA